MEHSQKGQRDLQPSLFDAATRIKKQIVDRANRHSTAFLATALLGFLCHTGAIRLTAYGVATGQAIESNSLFYSLGPSSFLVFGFLIMGAYYASIWFIRMPKMMQLSFAFSLTSVAVFDFVHDVFVSSYLNHLLALLSVIA